MIQSTGVSIFYSYSHKDEKFCETLRAHLSVLERKAMISSWYDRRIVPGQVWEAQIDKNIRIADVIILLVSADFVASDYCYQKELRIAMERHDSNQAIVVPILVRPVDFGEAPFSKIQALPKDAKPITKWENEDEAWLDVVKGVKKAIDEVNSLKNRTKFNEGFKSINHYLVRELSSIEDSFETGHERTTSRGLSTGLYELDRITDGLCRSDLVALAGRPGMGKTDLALKIACHAAIVEKKAVSYFSLNLPVDRLMRKMLCALGRIPIYKLFKGDLEENDWPKITSAVSLLKDLPLYIDDNMTLSLDDLANKARRTKKDEDVSLIIIDSLQHIEFNSDGVGFSSITKAMSKLAKELEIPIVITTSVDRDLEERPNKRPIARDLGEWRSIEEDADTLIFIYRDAVYNEDTSDTGMAELIISKNASGGPIGTAKVCYFSDMCSFEDVIEK